MPDRIKVTLSSDKEDYKPGEEIISRSSGNLFGTPATGRNYKTQTSFTQRYFSSKKFPDYNFNISRSDNN